MSNLRKANFDLACRHDVWLPIFGYEGIYEVNKRGLIRNAITLKNLRPGTGGSGYKTVSMSKDKKCKSFSVHRLVAVHFIPNPNVKEMVNHKDGNKLNNHISNLEWVTRSENEKHAHSIGLKNTPSPARGLYQMSCDGDIIKEYKSTIEAELYGFYSGCIALCCNGKRNTHKNFKWSYKN